MSEEEKRSYILIEFDTVGSAAFAIQTDNVTPLQLLSIAGFLEWKAKSLLQAQEFQAMQTQMKQKEMNKIIIPGK